VAGLQLVKKNLIDSSDIFPVLQIREALTTRTA